jgi:hypothetical protein
VRKISRYLSSSPITNYISESSLNLWNFSMNKWDFSMNLWNFSVNL